MAKSPLGSVEDAAREARQIGKVVMDSAQQIWLAGLGAFAKAQGEGSKLFDALVEEGAALDAKTRGYTEGRMHEMRGNVEHTFGQVRERGQATLDALENVFAQRVMRAMDRVGMPGRDEVDALTLRVDALERELAKLRKKPAAAKRPAAKSTTK